MDYYAGVRTFRCKRFRSVLWMGVAKPPRVVLAPPIRLQRRMACLGLTATGIDARKVQKALLARLNKSDAADAEGPAQLARTGGFIRVHIRSEEADRLRCLVGARESPC